MLPEGKPPFIGIEFSRALEAQGPLADFILNNQSKRFRIIIECYTEIAMLVLICDDEVEARYYNNVKIALKKLKAWRFAVERCENEINFGHLIKENGKLKVIKSGTPPVKVFLKIKKSQLFFVENPRSPTKRDFS